MHVLYSTEGLLIVIISGAPGINNFMHKLTPYLFSLKKEHCLVLELISILKETN